MWPGRAHEIVDIIPMRNVLRLDRPSVAVKYIILSMRFHPDKLGAKAPHEDEILSLDKLQALNSAYDMMRDSFSA